jgi:hypothetical protein
VQRKMKYYRPGMKVPTSGIYEALHGAGHRLEHEVTIAHGTLFPVCRRCAEDIRFKLVQSVKNHHHGFAPFGVLFAPYGTKPEKEPELLVA